MPCMYWVAALLATTLLVGLTSQAHLHSVSLRIRRMGEHEMAKRMSENEWARMHFQWYRRKIFETDIGAVRAAKARSRVPRATSSGVEVVLPKLAFLFLLHDRSEQEGVWDAFFQQADTNLFNVYIHRDAPNSSAGSFQNLSNSMPVPFTRSNWCALMGVQVAALTEALRDPENQQFVFVSHNAVPFKSFDYVYHNLVVSSLDTSKFCFASSEDNAGDCRFRDCNRNRGARALKHHQWIVLSRRHAEAVVSNTEIALIKYDTLREERAGVWEDPKICSDESVPLLALFELPEASQGLRSNTSAIWEDVERLGVEQRCTTFTYWPRCMIDSPLHLREVDDLGNMHPHTFSHIHQQYLQRLVNGPLLFGRKFPHDLVVTLEDTEPLPLKQLLPKMWAEVRDQGGASPLARLDAGLGQNS